MACPSGLIQNVIQAFAMRMFAGTSLLMENGVDTMMTTASQATASTATAGQTPGTAEMDTAMPGKYAVGTAIIHQHAMER